MTHYIIGYDEKDQMQLKVPVPTQTFASHFGWDDPMGYDSYELEFSEVYDLVRIASSDLKYYVECEKD